MINIQPIKLLSGSHRDTGSTGQGCFMNVIAYLNGEPQITDHSPCVCVTIRPIAIWLNDFMRHDERQQLIPFVMRAMGTATEDRQVIINRMEEVVSFSQDMASLVANSNSKFTAKSAVNLRRLESAVESAVESAQYASECARYIKSAVELVRYAFQSAQYAAECAQYAAECARYVEYAAECARYVEYAANLRPLESAVELAVELAPEFVANFSTNSAVKYATWCRNQLIARGIKFLDAVCPPLDSCVPQEVVTRAEKLVELNTVTH